MKNTVFILFLTIIFSCSTKRIDYSKSIVGEYSTINKKRTFFDILNSNYYYLNIKLEIKKNKTFTIKTCSYTAKGKWHISSDTFYYKYDTLKWLIDSLNYSKKYIKRKNKIIAYNRYLLIINENQLFLKRRDNNKNLIKKLMY